MHRVIFDETSDGIHYQKSIDTLLVDDFRFERIKATMEDKPVSELIISVTHGDQRIALGDLVVSNGRFVTKGLRGIVVAIVLPHMDGRTSDILDVLFEGARTTRPFPTSMKFKDIE